MKHVVTAAPLRQSVLVTGFGAFPGAPRNPTARILVRLQRQRSRLQRLGIELHCILLPVAYGRIETALTTAVAAHRPDAILHLGLAGRRRHVSVETRAINRANPLHPDAGGRVPLSQRLAPGRPSSLAATYSAVCILAAIRGCGLAARLSIDAGDYVCNATLYRSLADQAATQIGFLHVPKTQPSMQPKARTKRPKPTIDALTRATLAAVLVITRRAPGRSRAAAADEPKAPSKGDSAEAR